MEALQLAAQAAQLSAWLGPLLCDYILSPLITMISCLLSIFVVLGNLLVVTAIWHENQLHTVTNYLIGSLAAADCLVGALVMPFNIISEIILDRWTFGATWCDVWHSFDVLASTASIMNLCAISLDRYLAITNPISYPTKMTPKRVAFLIVFIWTCSALISFPAIAWWHAVGPAPLQEISRRVAVNQPQPQPQQQQQQHHRHRNLTSSAGSGSEELSAGELEALAAAGQALEASHLIAASSSSNQLQHEEHNSRARQLPHELKEYRCVFTDDTYYLLFSSFVSFYGPLCVMLYAYYCIYRAAVQQTRFLKYGSKQVIVSAAGSSAGPSRAEACGQAGAGGAGGAASQASGAAKSDKCSSSERDCDGLSSNGAAGDRQRLVLRVHRGGGANHLASANLSNCTYKSTSDASNLHNTFGAPPPQSMSKRNMIASVGSVKLAAASRKCDSNKSSLARPAASDSKRARAANSLSAEACDMNLQQQQQHYRRHQVNGSAVQFDAGQTSGSPPRASFRPRASRRDELRVQSQRFDSVSSPGTPSGGANATLSTCGGSASNPLLPLEKQQASADGDPLQPLQPDRRSLLASEASSDSRNSVVTVEQRSAGPPALDPLEGRSPASSFKRRRRNSSPVSGSSSGLRFKSKSCREVATSTASASTCAPRPEMDEEARETDELLARTREVLRHFRRTISLESALGLTRKRERRRALEASLRLGLAPGGGGGGGDAGAQAFGAAREGAPPGASPTQPAPACHQASDRLIRGIVDLAAIHYIDCAGQTRSSATAEVARAPPAAPTNSRRALGKSMSQLGPGTAATVQTTRRPAAGRSSSPEQQQHQQHQQQQLQQNGKKLTKLAKERKAAKTLGIVVGVFILCWLPFFVVNIVVATCGIGCVYKPHILISIVTWLGWLNSAMNPVIYACWSRDFRRAFRKTLCTWVEFVCYDGATLARKLRLKKGSSYLNTQEAFLSKSNAAGSFKVAGQQQQQQQGRHLNSQRQGRALAQAASSSRSNAVSIEVEANRVSAASLGLDSRQPSSEV